MTTFLFIKVIFYKMDKINSVDKKAWSYKLTLVVSSEAEWQVLSTVFFTVEILLLVVL